MPVCRLGSGGKSSKFKMAQNVWNIGLTQNGVTYSESTSYFKKYSSSKCKQTVCLHTNLTSTLMLRQHVYHLLQEYNVPGGGGGGDVLDSEKKIKIISSALIKVLWLYLLEDIFTIFLKKG